MHESIIESLRTEMEDTPIARVAGRVSGLRGARVFVDGLSDVAALGDRVIFGDRPGAPGGEIIEIDGATVAVLPETRPEGLGLGHLVIHIGPTLLRPDDSWIGRIIDPMGVPLDDRPLRRGLRLYPLHADPPNAAQRRGFGPRLATGLSVFDTMLPITAGQRLGLFAGSGVGKSSLLARLATGVEADVVVVALVGERGRELREFTERVLGPDGMRKSIVVAATADRSPLLRRRAAETAMTVAEFFRDQGRNVLLLTDSITRYAEAHREIALLGGEPAAMRGYPPSMAQRVMSLAERAGTGSGSAGDITALFTVLVAGSDMEEPVADTLRGVLDGHVVLDREIAERGRFPAVDVARSVSRSLPGAATPDENQVIAEARALLGVWNRSELMVQAGLHTPGADPAVDRAVAIWPGLDSYFASSAPDGVEGSFARLKSVLEGSPAASVQ